MKLSKLLCSGLVASVSLISGCGDEPLFSDPSQSVAASGGSGGAVPVLMTHIPDEIATAAAGTQVLSVSNRVFMGNTDSQLLYVATGTVDLVDKFYRLDGTELDQVSAGANDVSPVMSGDGSVIIYPKSGRFYVAVISSGVIREIGAAVDFSSVENIATTDTGDKIAFISNRDLAGTNPSSISQIFTLTTDGTDVVAQVSSFTSSFFPLSERQIAFSGDGGKIFFKSASDVLGDGGNADGSDEIFSIQSDGSGLARLTNVNSSSVSSIRSDSSGNALAFTIADKLHALDVASGNSVEIKSLIPSGATSDIPIMYDISSDGSTVTYIQARSVSRSQAENILFANSISGNNEVQLFTTEVFTGDAGFPVIISPEITANGGIVVFSSLLSFGQTVGGENTRQIFGVSR